jgi:predicted MFS family arabinose efflux permease
LSAKGIGRREPRVWRAATTGLIALLISIGFSRFGFPPLIPALIEAHWFDAGAAAYLGATNLAGYLLGAWSAQYLARYLPTSLLIKGALLLAVASFVACAFPLGFAWYFVWRLLSGIIGGIVMVLAAPAILAATPAGARGRVAGILFTGVGLGVFLSGSLAPWLVRLGLPATWLAFAGASAVLLVIAWGGLPRHGTAAAPHDRPARPPITRPVIGLVLAYTCFAIGFVPHTVFWVDYIARGLGAGLTVGGHYWALVGIAACCGPLIGGFVSERLGFAVPFRLGLSLVAVGLVLPILSDDPLALALSSIAGGALGTGLTTIAAGRAGELVALEHHRHIWAWATIAFSVAYAAMGYVFSWIFDATGSYHLLFALAAGAALLGAALDLVLDQRAATAEEAAR